MSCKRHLAAMFHRERCDRGRLIPMLDKLTEPEAEALYRMIETIRSEADVSAKRRFMRLF